MTGGKCAVTAPIENNPENQHKNQQAKKNVHKNGQQQNVTAVAAKTNKQAIANRKSAGANWTSAVQNNNNNSNDKENGKTMQIKVQLVDATEQDKVDENNSQTEQKTQEASKQTRRRKRAKWGNRHVAMDCEMVGIGTRGEDDMLARVSIVNRHGQVLLDKYVKPTVDVVDYRTEVSGIRPQDIADGEDFKVVQSKVIEILDGKVLVGHGLRKDLQVLKITHPHHKVRDTSAYKPLARLVSGGRTPSLKRLAHCVLGEHIQTGEHDSVEDARAAMNIYNTCCAGWEETLQRKMR